MYQRGVNWMKLHRRVRNVKTSLFTSRIDRIKNAGEMNAGVRPAIERRLVRRPAPPSLVGRAGFPNGTRSAAPVALPRETH